MAAAVTATASATTHSGTPRIDRVNVEDTDAAPVLANGKIYVGTNAGSVYTYKATTGAPYWSAPYSVVGDGPVKGYVWPHSSGVVYFSTNNRVHAINDAAEGSTPTSYWTSFQAIASASPPVVRSGRVYVGGSNSRLYSIDATAVTPPTPNEVVLGDPLVAKVVGSPTIDTGQNLALVGTDQGVVYAVQLPF